MHRGLNGYQGVNGENGSNSNDETGMTNQVRMPNNKEIGRSSPRTLSRTRLAWLREVDVVVRLRERKKAGSAALLPIPMTKNPGRRLVVSDQSLSGVGGDAGLLGQAAVLDPVRLVGVDAQALLLVRFVRLVSCPRTRRPGCRLRRPGCAWRRGRGTSGRG